MVYCPHGMLGCYSPSFVFWAAHPLPAIAMLGHSLRPHTPWVPTAPAFALSSETLQELSNKAKRMEQNKDRGVGAAESPISRSLRIRLRSN